jgi:hypothetical protein
MKKVLPNTSRQNTMSSLEPRDRAEVTTVEDIADFREFQARGHCGVMIVPETFGEPPRLAVRDSAGDFAKWVKENAPTVAVELRQPADRLVLRSADYWLPLVFLSSDVSVQFYLNLVANYVYDKLRGALKGETIRVRFSVVYEAPQTGTIKRFDFEGDEQALAKTIKRFDLNRFLDD